ncbi:MAG: DUF503 family protein [Pseudomonadota bacterium]
MKVGALRAGFYLHGCRSLKEKRQRLARLRDKFGKNTAMGVCESNFADDLRQAEWTFVACASTDRVVQQALADVETYLKSSVDAEVTRLDREWLA